MFVDLSCREWLINIRGFAKKLRSTSLSSADQIKDCGACRECPNCHSRIDNSDVCYKFKFCRRIHFEFIIAHSKYAPETGKYEAIDYASRTPDVSIDFAYAPIPIPCIFLLLEHTVNSSF